MRLILKPLLLLLPFIFHHVSANRDDPDLQIMVDNPNGKNQPEPPRIGGPPTIYSSKLTFKNNKDVWKDILEENDGKLSQLAKDAWWQMNKRWVADGVDLDHRPYVMTALVVGSEVYLSSSMRTGAFILWAKDEQNPVYHALNQCQTAHRLIHDNKRPAGGDRLFWDIHLNKASCGEPMSLYAYFQDHPEEAHRFLNSEDTALKNSRIATVRNLNFNDQRDPEKLRTELPYEGIVRFNPCGTDQRNIPQPLQYGCWQLTQRFGLIPIEELPLNNGEFADLDLNKDDMMITQTPLRCRQPTTS